MGCRARRARIAGLRWVLPIAVGLALLQGCGEAYPPADAPVIDPRAMSQPERLDAMNGLGEDAHPQRDWGYALAPGCRLQVTVRHEGEPFARFAIALLRKQADTPFNRQQQLYEVRLPRLRAAANADASVPPVILQSLQWADAILMRGLVEAVQAECRRTPF